MVREPEDMKLVVVTGFIDASLEISPIASIIARNSGFPCGSELAAMVDLLLREVNNIGTQLNCEIRLFFFAQLLARSLLFFSS